MISMQNKAVLSTRIAFLRLGGKLGEEARAKLKVARAQTNDSPVGSHSIFREISAN